MAVKSRFNLSMALRKLLTAMVAISAAAAGSSAALAAGWAQGAFTLA